MTNYEYAQATQAELDAWWECAAFEAWQADQETEREMAYMASLAAQGLGNIY